MGFTSDNSTPFPCENEASSSLLLETLIISPLSASRMETWSANVLVTVWLIILPIALVGLVLYLLPTGVCYVMLLILWLGAGVFLYESFIHKE